MGFRRVARVWEEAQAEVHVARLFVRSSASFNSFPFDSDAGGAKQKWNKRRFACEFCECTIFRHVQIYFDNILECELSDWKFEGP